MGMNSQGFVINYLTSAVQSYIGLLASAIVRMEGIGGLAGWRWIFILEGIVTVLFGFIAWMMMPADLASANFFTDEEREFAGT